MSAAKKRKRKPREPKPALRISPAHLRELRFAVRLLYEACRKSRAHCVQLLDLLAAKEHERLRYAANLELTEDELQEVRRRAEASK